MDHAIVALGLLFTVALLLVVPVWLFVGFGLIGLAIASRRLLN